MNLLFIVLMALFPTPSTSCKSHSQTPTKSISNISAKTKLDSRIPKADPSKYKDVRDGNDWQNPYLVVHPNGIEIISTKGTLGERKIVSTDCLADALTTLPLTDWPYGRIVAISNIGIRNGFFGSPVYEKDEQLISKNKIEAGKILKSLKVKADWWPSN